MTMLHESPQKIIENIRNSNEILNNEINFRRSSVHKITIKKQVQQIVANIKNEQKETKNEQIILPNISLNVPSKTEPFNRNSGRRKSIRQTLKRDEKIFPKSNSCVNIKDQNNVHKNYDPEISPNVHISTNGKRFRKNSLVE